MIMNIANFKLLFYYKKVKILIQDETATCVYISQNQPIILIASTYHTLYILTFDDQNAKKTLTLIATIELYYKTMYNSIDETLCN